MKQWMSIYCLCILIGNTLVISAKAYAENPPSVSEIRNYLVQNNILTIVELPKGNPEREKYKKNLMSFADNGYTDYIAFAIHYARHADYPKKLNEVLIAYEKFLEVTRKNIISVNQAPLFDQEYNVLETDNIFPEAKKSVQSLKANELQYHNVLKASLLYLIGGFGIRLMYIEGESNPDDKLDCDESTIIFQKLSTIIGIPPGNYIHIHDHIALKLHDFPIVIDTEDIKLKSLSEFAQEKTINGGKIGSYFWRDSENYYLAQYETSDLYPKKIVTYNKITEKPYVVTKYEDVSGLLLELAYNRQLSVSKRINLYEFILEFNPSDAEAYLNYAELLKQSNTEKAKEYYEKTLTMDRYNAEAHNDYALLLHNQGGKERAKEHYEVALSLNPNYFSAHNNYARWLKENGNKENAKKHLEISLVLNPSNASAYNNYAILLQAEGNKAKAKEYYEKALNIDPSYAVAHYNYAQLLNDLENYKESRKHLEIYHQLKQNSNDDLYKKLDEQLKNKGF